MENQSRSRGFHRPKRRGSGRTTAPGYSGGHSQEREPNQVGTQPIHGGRDNTNWRDRSRSEHNFRNTQPFQNDNQLSGQVRKNLNKPERTMGFPFVQKLLNNNDLSEVILQLSNDRNGFSKLLESKDISNDLIVLLVRLLWRVCDSTFQEVKIMVLSLALQSRFMEKLTLYVTQLINQTAVDKLRNKHFWNDPDNFWQNLINLSKTVQEIIPTKCETVRQLLKSIRLLFLLDEEGQSVPMSDEIKAQTMSVLDIVERTVEGIQVKRQKLEQSIALPMEVEPPDDFRQIHIIPSVHEIITETSPFLRANIVDKAFTSTNQYLDIQFRLLREDFVAPLRRGINIFLKNQSKAKKDWKKLENIKVYSPIRFLCPETVNECNCYRMRFDFSKKKRSFKYENSKRFMFGSLVCFTCDNFKSLLFGKIVDRDIKLLEEGLLVVGFLEQIQINYEVDYVMIESAVYFEPYYQVLGVLQKMSIESFPMEKYIIKVETDTTPPEYLLKADPVFYNIEGTRFWSLNVPMEERFYNLNDSQLSAFRAALTQEFCIIQGPPGTGKTFLGLKIAHTLLDNRHAWYTKTPILVLCYTNHALDQFLEGILPLTDQILRVGGQSKNENLKQYNLAFKRRNFSRQAAVLQKRRDVIDYITDIKTLSDKLNEIDANESVLSFNCFIDIVQGYKNTWFYKADSDNIKMWLLEGKRNLREKVTKHIPQLEDGMESMAIAGQGQENAEDLDSGDDSCNSDWFDELFSNINVSNRHFTPLITLQELRDELGRLKSELNKILSPPDSLEMILREEHIHMAIWETKSDLTYIENQLFFFKNPLNRRKPEHVDLNNPHNMLPQDRWQLYFHWVELYAAGLRRRSEKTYNKFREVFRVYNDMREIEDTQIMKEHLVVGMTTTGAARLHSSLQALKSPIVIVEEAAEILEAHVVAALTSHCKHLILIGDHLQLKPGAADYKVEKKLKLGISLFERMVNNNIHCHTLNVQHRMRPEISRFIKPHIYQNLEDHESTLQRAPILGMEKCVYFIDHQEQEDLCQDASKKNIHESQFIIALARHLILNGYKPEQITILAGYLGQFFEMIREKKKPNNQMLLQDVRIAVLDNYQGEESDIILLSLVRSNAENKAGFLRTQNRVCVALSRARDGLYIMGNMSLLLKCDSENQIWEKVKGVLEEQNAIGTHLTLTCQIHPHRVTRVSKGEDFMKLSEGGCDLLCEAKLVCEHNCKRLCHVQDKEHTSYKCNEECTRLLCDDPAHICKKRCYEDCGPCTYLVSRDLDCGHKVDIQCHIDPNNYKCQELVVTKLPCDHEANKPCSVNPNVFRCPHPCDSRVEPCGHSCDMRCHIRMDPDHLKYKCRQRCAKPAVGCRESENQHVCTKFCFQECEACILPVKKVKSCGHVYTMQCNEDVEELLCKKPCKEILACGHKCKNKCFETCSTCKETVEKTIPDCQHKIKIACHKTPSRNDCRSKICPRTLACGHKCYKPCSASCTDTCRIKVNCDISAPCGHTLNRIPCALKDTTDPDILLKYCTSPCSTELKCKHKCPGTCGECMQSRIHKRCAEKCGVPLVCNHECPIPCREACKPCTQPCGIKCRHSKCKKKCGEVCTPCKAPCSRKCQHVTCSNYCGDICNVPPCSERCQRKLKCGHPCVGFCGDPCPRLCRICNKEELQEIFFGTEDDQDAIFVLLNDCKHVLEHTGLENWLNQGGNQIQFKTCPKCKTNITTTERYSDYVKRAIQDVGLVKIMCYGKSAENETVRQELLNNLLKLDEDPTYFPKACSKLGDVLSKLKIRLEPSRDQRRQPINKQELNSIILKTQTCFSIVDCFKENKEPYTSPERTILHVNVLLDVLLRSEDHITDQEIEDLDLEIKRLNRMVQFDEIKKSDQSNVPLDSIKSLTENIEGTLFERKRYTDILDNAVRINLIELAAKIKSAVIISDNERNEIVQALRVKGISAGHWFKCPNGHPYAIGECGGAMEVARCLCGAAIGGTNHHLLPSNQLAGEMDNATRHAWPGGLH